MGLLEFLHTGGGQPPWWYLYLLLANRWHCKPWELDDAPLEWVLRQLEATAVESEALRLRPEALDGIPRRRWT